MTSELCVLGHKGTENYAIKILTVYHVSPCIVFSFVGLMSHFFRKKKRRRKLFCLLLLLLEHFNTTNTVWEQLIDRRRLFLFISEIMIAVAASNDRMLIIHDRKK